MIPTLHTPYKSTIINSYIISRCIYVYDMCVLKYAITYLYLHIHVYMFTYKITRFVCTFTLNMKPVSRSKLADLRVFREWPRSAQSIVRVSVWCCFPMFLFENGWCFAHGNTKKKHILVFEHVLLPRNLVLNPIYSLWVDWGMLSINPWKWRIKPRLSIYHLYINVE